MAASSVRGVRTRCPRFPGAWQARFGRQPPAGDGPSRQSGADERRGEGKMRIVMTGAGRMIGRKLAARLAADGTIAGQTITAMRLHDIVPPPVPARLSRSPPRPRSVGARGRRRAGRRPARDGDPSGLGRLGPGRGGVRPVAIGSTSTAPARSGCDPAGGAPATGHLCLDPRGLRRPFPDVVPDDFAPMPLSSYGTQKLIGELILADYSRRGFMDGIGLRLPTICVRPGAPNRAASGFFSSIIREPLVGQRALLPVPRDWVHSHASPRAAVGFFFCMRRGSTRPRCRGGPTSPCPGCRPRSPNRSRRWSARPRAVGTDR